MARIEKTVFISYRRTDVYTALAVYENLKNQGYDVFFDYRSISSGDFEQIITSNIRARAHFLLILTPTVLDRCSEPGDWLRREIEIAMDEKRNIVPLFFKEFRFGTPSVTEKLTGKLKNLSRYNGLNVHEDYFDEAMQRLRTQYLNIPLDTILHPVSTEVQKIVREEQVAADKALEQIEDVKELVKQVDTTSNFLEAKPNLKLKPPFLVRRKTAESPNSDFNFRAVGGIAGGMLIIALLIWSASELSGNLPTTAVPTGSTLQTNPTFSSQPALTLTSEPEQSNTPSAAETSVDVTPTLDIGSTMLGKDGMTLLYVPAGKFTMGYDSSSRAEKPMHTVYLDAFWIDQTEVTNKMYAQCVSAGACKELRSKSSYTHSSYYGNAEFDNYPVIYVDWNMAKTYCEWAGRHLPTEAEWEKAAHRTDASIYPWGNDLPNNNLLNYNNAIGDTTEVGTYFEGASLYGALDMAGNVAEWVNDWFSETYYSSSPSSNPVGPDSGTHRVFRGGQWEGIDYGAVRSASRGLMDPTTISFDIGMRCASSQTELAESTKSIQSATNTVSPVQTFVSPTSAFGIGSSMTGKDGMTLLYVPAGEFMMGSNSGGAREKPVHLVYLDAFWIDQTEVTNKMYAQCVEADVCEEPTNKSSFTRSSYYGIAKYDNYPVIYVDWNMAKTYCEWAGRHLPTEAEWEKAARGTDQRVFPWGDEIGATFANYDKSIGDTTAVGSYESGKSFYGAYDMAGNVWEWVYDWIGDSSYYGSQPSNPLGPRSGTYRVIRGGSWIDSWQGMRSANRNGFDPPFSYHYLGFRCSRPQ